jgi:hypothetical protein
MSTDDIPRRARMEQWSPAEKAIAWLPQSANSPIRIDEASRLLNILNGHEL